MCVKKAGLLTALKKKQQQQQRQRQRHTKMRAIGYGAGCLRVLLAEGVVQQLQLHGWQHSQRQKQPQAMELINSSA